MCRCTTSTVVSKCCQCTCVCCTLRKVQHATNTQICFANLLCNCAYRSDHIADQQSGAYSASCVLQVLQLRCTGARITNIQRALVRCKVASLTPRAA